MPVYQPGIPTGTVNLDVDYLNLQGNFQQANIVYGTDHYPFDNATPNQGFHNLVTTPPVVNNPPDGLPPATAANPKFYAFQQYAAIGVLQYSRGPTNRVPTPLTTLQSTSTPIAIPPGNRVNVLDFTGMTIAIANLYVFDSVTLSSRNLGIIFWSSTGGVLVNNQISNQGLVASSTGNVLQILNTTAQPRNSVFWTLQFMRIQ